MPTDINPSQIPKLIPLRKLMGLPLRQTLTVVWHSGQFLICPDLKRGVESGLFRFHYRGLVRCGIIFHLFQSLLLSKPIALFFSHMSQIAEPTTLPRQHVGETSKVFSDFVFFVDEPCHGKNLVEIPLLMKSWNKNRLWRPFSKVALEEEWGDWLVSQRQAWFRKGYDGMSVIKHGFPVQMEVWTGRLYIYIYIIIYYYYYYYYFFNYPRIIYSR